MDESIQNIKVEIESIKKIQSKKKLEIKKLGTQKETFEESFTKRIQEMEEGISGIDVIIEEILNWSEKMIKLKTF